MSPSVGVGSAEGMATRGVGGPQRLDLVKRIGKQETFEAGTICLHAGQPPSCQASDAHSIPDLCPSGVLGPSIPLVAFSICSSFAEKRLWSSLEQTFETESFPFVPAGTKEQCPRLAASVPARVQGLPS